MVLLFGAMTFAFAADSEYNRKTADIRIRDPFVLLHDGLYYMYGTGAAQGLGYGCYVSPDLENWSGPYNVFTAPAGFDGVQHFWAPECHEYNGQFYLFATYFAQSTQHRGVAIFRADSPLGPFEQISNGHITPHDTDSIDGTLFVENGKPYMIYVQEHTAQRDHIGRMAIAEMSDDLTRFVSEPKTLFRANSPLWTDSRVTDGPFVYRMYSGRYVMLWSNTSDQGYCVGMATARSLFGPWHQQLTRLYKRGNGFPYDGGHGMLFTDKNGQLTMCIHAPNNAGDGRVETAEFLPVQDLGYTLALDGVRLSFADRILQFCDRVLSFIF